MKQELKAYIRSYIAAWQNVGVQSSEAEQRDVELPVEWEFYVKHGLFASEGFYADFLKKNGFAELPDLLLTMDSLQDRRKCIWQTDGDPRQVPFPSAFQSAFVKIAEECAISGNQGERNGVREVFRVLHDLGMSRIHQSLLLNDFHVLSVSAWLSLFDDQNANLSAQATSRLSEEEVEMVQRGCFYEKCIAEYGRSWVAVICEMEEWADRSFSPENERRKISEIAHWADNFRTFCGSCCAYTRCLETTDIRWLPHLLEYFCIMDPGGEHEYVSRNFQKALAKFCRHYANVQGRPENYKSLATALGILKDKYGLSILPEDNSFCGSDCRCSAMKLEMEQLLTMQVREFDVEEWRTAFNDAYKISMQNSDAIKAKPIACGVEDQFMLNLKPRSIFGKLKDLLLGCFSNSKSEMEQSYPDYLQNCRKEYCIHDFGGKWVDAPEFSAAVHCSATLSRLVSLVSPILKREGGQTLLAEIMREVVFAQQAVFRDALPHAAKEWPRPLKHHVQKASPVTHST